MTPLSDEDWMRRCRELAKEAAEKGNPAVGSVIVLENRMISEAGERVVSDSDLSAHAEFLAIRDAFQILKRVDLSGATLYTNVEPCWMCSYLIRESNLSQVVIGRPIGCVGGATSQFDILTTSQNEDWKSPPEIRWLITSH